MLTSPVGTFIVGVGKEIVCFNCPRFVQFVDSVKIAGWSGVEYFHCITL